MGVRSRLQRLEKILPPPPPPTAEERQETRCWYALTRRFIDQLDRAFPDEGEPEFGVVKGALREYLDRRSGPLHQWLWDLEEGRSRVPELSAETMRQVALCWLHPAAGDAMVCNQCGLGCPRYDNRVLPLRYEPDLTKLADLPQRGKWPRYFELCPGCGASDRDVDWPHLVGGKHPPWKALDGWVGFPNRKRKEPRT